MLASLIQSPGCAGAMSSHYGQGFIKGGGWGGGVEPEPKNAHFNINYVVLILLYEDMKKEAILETITITG